jgi:hypothetical protein
MKKSPRIRAKQQHSLLARIDRLKLLFKNNSGTAFDATLNIYHHLVACEFLNDAGMLHVSQMVGLMEAGT